MFALRSQVIITAPSDVLNSATRLSSVSTESFGSKPLCFDVISITFKQASNEIVSCLMTFLATSNWGIGKRVRNMIRYFKYFVLISHRQYLNILTHFSKKIRRTNRMAQDTTTGLYVRYPSRLQMATYLPHLNCLACW